VLALPDAAARLFFGHLLRNRSQDGADLFQQGIWRDHDLSLARHCTWRAQSDSLMVDITFVYCLSTTRVPCVELSNQVDNEDNINEPCPDHCFWQASDSMCTTVLTVTLSKKKKTGFFVVMSTTNLKMMWKQTTNKQMYLI